MFTKEQVTRYARHFVLPQIGPKGQQRLLDSSVLVIGAGGLGSAALYYLAAAGVGVIGIADGDKVGLSNLQRQIIHRTDRIDEWKTDSARETIRQLNPDVRVQLHPFYLTPENILGVLEPYDFVIDATDRFETKYLVNDACVLSGKPYVHAGVVGFRGQVMTYIPDGGPCLRCILPEIPDDQGAPCAQAGILGAVAGILGSIQAAEAVKYLVQVGELLTGRILYVDALSMEFRVLHCKEKNPECSICGKHPTIHNLLDEAENYIPRDCAGEGKT